MKAAVCSAAILVGSLDSPAAGQSFQNLGFESATFVPVAGDPYNRVQFSPALTGWTGYLETIPQALALYDFTFISGLGLGIVDVGWPYRGRILGNFSAFLQPATGMNIDASIAQTGMVPLLSQSLLFNAIPKADPSGDTVGSPDGTFTVSLGGQILPLITFGPGPNNSIMYGADIQGWGGQTTELRFTAFAQLGQTNEHNRYHKMGDVHHYCRVVVSVGNGAGSVPKS